MAVQLVGLTQFPRVWEDETWYSNVAYNFSIGNGFINTNVGTRGGDDLFFFTFILGVFYKIFGVSIFVSRIVTVIIGLVTLLGFYSIGLFFKLRKRVLLLILLMVVFSNVYYIVFRSVRPESIIILLGIWSLYFLLKTINNSKPIYYFVTGLLTSLAFLSHPDGGIFGLLFGIYFFIRSIQECRIKPIVLYIIGTLPILIALFINIIYFQEQTLTEIFGGWMSRSSANNNEQFFISRFYILIDFFNQYTLGFKRIFIFVFEISLLVIGLFFYKKNRIIFLLSIFGLGLCITHVFMYSRLSTRSFGEVTIFSFLILAMILNELKLKKQPYLILILFSVFYLINNVAGEFYVLSKNLSNTSYSIIEKEVDYYVDDDKKVLSLLCLWFPLINNKNYNNYTRWDKTEYSNLEAFLETNEMDYVVISDMLAYGKTQTSGRSVSASKLNTKLEYYHKVINHARQNGVLIKQIPTKGYSTIEIWKIEKGRSKRLNRP